MCFDLSGCFAVSAGGELETPSCILFMLIVLLLVTDESDENETVQIKHLKFLIVFRLLISKRG